MDTREVILEKNETTTSDNKISQNTLNPNVYPIDVFMKYRDANIGAHPNFYKYYSESVNKFKRQDFLDRPELRTKLNFIILKKHISNEDDILYKLLMKTLNKVNNKMLTQDLKSDQKSNFKENSLQHTIEVLTTTKYTKVEHFQKLAEMLVDKSLSEQNFCSIYAIICYELSKYYIITGASNKVHFRSILLNICQTNFETFLNKCDTVDRSKLIGIAKFLGELYNKGLLPSPIIKGCFDRMIVIIDKVQNICECISELVMITYKKLYEEFKETGLATPKYFKTCLHTQIDNNKLPLKCKFALQAALEKIEQIEKKLK